MALEPHLILLVLFAALVHASWNAVVKSAAEPFLTFTVIHATGTVLAIFAFPLVPALDPAAWPFLLVSALVHNAYYVFLLASYRAGDLSQIYPVARGTAPLLVAIGGAIFAAEIPGHWGILGLGLASAGIMSLAFAKGWPVKGARRPLILAFTTAGLIASYTVIDGLGIRRAGDAFSFIVWLNFLEGIPFTLWALSMRRRDVAPFLRVNWRRGLFGGVLTTLAYGCALYALNEGAMASVAALRETSVLFAVVIGCWLLKEPFGRSRLLAAAAITAGVIILQTWG